MKIVIIPGVGFHKNRSRHANFAKQISHNIPNCETEIFYWKHDWPNPDIELPYKGIRRWLFEVILDFQHVIKHAYHTECPPADYYIGHSAGSILSIAQPNESCIIFGSPAILVECINESRTTNIETVEMIISHSVSSKKNILNIINKYDLLAYYLNHNNVTNFVYNTSLWNLNTYNPYLAHQDYWTNPYIIKKVSDQIKSWEYDRSS